MLGFPPGNLELRQGRPSRAPQKLVLNCHLRHQSLHASAACQLRPLVANATKCFTLVRDRRRCSVGRSRVAT